MKCFGLWIAVLIASTAHLFAQVTVEVTLNQDQFLPGEALTAAVRITNRSGQTMRLGETEHWIKFSVESRDGAVVLKLGDAPVVGEFLLESSHRATKRVDLEPYFDLRKPGRYAVTATVFLKEWNQQVTSAPKGFDIIQGAKLWEQQIGVPGAPGEPPEVRTYTLQQANYLKHLMLYFRLSDTSGKVSKVFPIGPILSFGKPEPQVDRFSNLHVFYQNGARSYSYSVINPDGEIILRQTYDITSRPRLNADENGVFTIVGGRRRVTPNDLPPPITPISNASTNTP